jgi:hypothetical protein
MSPVVAACVIALLAGCTSSNGVVSAPSSGKPAGAGASTASSSTGTTLASQNVGLAGCPALAHDANVTALPADVPAALMGDAAARGRVHAAASALRGFAGTVNDPQRAQSLRQASQALDEATAAAPSSESVTKATKALTQVSAALQGSC